MGFLDDLKKGAAQAAQAAAHVAEKAVDKSGDLIEIGKLKMDIKSSEDKIRELYEDIGKAVYAKYDEGSVIDSSHMPAVEQIKSINHEIDNLKAKVEELGGKSGDSGASE